MPSVKVTFENQDGHILAAKLELPNQPHPIGFAIFAHVFTGSKNLKASRVISKALNINGFGVLRFDFTGLGDSEGEFSDTNFTSNVMDLLAAADYLEANYQAPSLIVGHSLGGSASIVAGSKIDSIKAIATIGSPFDPKHVTHLLSHKMNEIEKKGEAKVTIQGRSFTIKEQFIHDLLSQNMTDIIKNLNKALLVMHSPQDRIVEIENAANLYKTANHPKSFITLNGADHMLTNKDDAYYTGEVIATWAKRYMPPIDTTKEYPDSRVFARTISGALTTEVMAGQHGFLVDESEKLGGNDFGPTPYELFCSSLAASTSMIIEEYAESHQIHFESVDVQISFESKYRLDIADTNRIPLQNVKRKIIINGEISLDEQEILKQIADQCPVYRTMNSMVAIQTSIEMKSFS